MAAVGAEHTAPGEEQVVFSRTAGVVASKVSYMDILDPTNDWQVLESPHEDEASPLTCQFNYRGTHLAVGDESGRIDLWSFVPLRLYVKSLELTRELVDKLRAPTSLAERATGNFSGAVGEEGGVRTNEEKELRRESTDLGWTTASVDWSRCSRYILAAYVQKRKNWPNGEAIRVPGLVAYWNVVEGQVEGYLRLESRVMHVSLSPRNPRRGSVCCENGTSFVADFPAPAKAAVASSTLQEAVPIEEVRCHSVINNVEERFEEKEPCARDTEVVSSDTVLRDGKRPVRSSADSRLESARDGGGPADVEEPGGDGSGANKHTTYGCRNVSSDCVLSAPAVTLQSTEKPKLSSAILATSRKIWDPVIHTELFQAPMVAAGSMALCADPGTGGSEGGMRFNVDADAGLGTIEETSAGDDGVSTGIGAWRSGNVASAGSACGVSSRSSGGGGGSRASTKIPVQAGRVAWCEDGETLFLLTNEGNLLKVGARSDGSLALLARVDIQGGASPSTLQLSPQGDKLLIATATKGLCLIPTKDLDISRAEFFGENFGTRGTKARFWGTATLGNVHGRGQDGCQKLRLTVVGNPSKTRDDKTDLFFFDVGGDQPNRVDTPRREGVISLACSPHRPLLLFLCPTGEIYFREEVLKTDFPGPWYPSGYVLIDNNVDYLEAENQLDTVVMTGPNGEVLSKTQAHEVVVPWQHQAVAEGEATVGTMDEAVDVDGRSCTELWTDTEENELRWIPEVEDIPLSQRTTEKGLARNRSTPRGGGLESPGGPWAYLLGATPTLLKEARKRSRPAGFWDEYVAGKRRNMVSTMLQDLMAKKKKQDEEAVKRKRKQEETRAKAKRNREKKAAAEAEKVAEKAKSVAERTPCTEYGSQGGDCIMYTTGVESERTVTQHTGPVTCAPSDAGLEEPLATAGHPFDNDQMSGSSVVAASFSTSAVGTDICHPPPYNPTGLTSSGYDGSSSMGGAAADAAAWLAAAAPGREEVVCGGASAPVSAHSSRDSSRLLPNAQHNSHSRAVPLAAAHNSFDDECGHLPRGLVPQRTPRAGNNAVCLAPMTTSGAQAISNETTSASAAIRDAASGVASGKNPFSERSPGPHGTQQQPFREVSVLTRVFAQGQYQAPAEKSMASSPEVGLDTTALRRDGQGDKKEVVGTTASGKMMQRDVEGSSAVFGHNPGPDSMEQKKA